MRVLRVRFLALALGEKYVRDEIFVGNAYLSGGKPHRPRLTWKISNHQGGHFFPSKFPIKILPSHQWALLFLLTFGGQNDWDIIIRTGVKPRAEKPNP